MPALFLPGHLFLEFIQHSKCDIVLLIIPMRLIACDDGVIPILDHVFSSSVAEGCLHFGPFLASPLQHILKNNVVFFRLPVPLYFCGVEVVMPSFPAMFRGDEFLPVS